MKKEILNIVITGGPCGGKTTALDEITKLLRGCGYSVYIVNETATELKNDGMKPYGNDMLTIKDFQELILDAQIAKEDIRRKAAICCPNSKVAILYDRGILDNRAYIDDATFEEFLKKRNLSEAEILTRYDLVLHMVSAAIDKEEYYTTDNNLARNETAYQAAIQDRKTMKTWKNHPNLKIIGNDTLFDGKIQKVKNIIRAYIGEKEVLKQERYLVELKNLVINKFNNTMVKEYIEEFTLNYDPSEIEIYSKSTINGSSYYTSLKKEKYGNGKKCYIISEKEYYDRRKKVRGKTLNKIRYNFIEDDERYRLDLFDIDGKSFMILERDIVKDKYEKLPDFITQAVDITNNRNYDDDSIFIDYNIECIYKRQRSL